MKTFLSIEIQEQKVRYFLVEQGIKGMAFKGAGESTLQVGPLAPGALASFVKELSASRQVKVDRLFLTVNRPEAVVHQFNLGQVSKSDLEMIIKAEIEKIPSFMERDFDYVHQQYDLKSRSKIIFGAMTDHLLQYLLKEIEQTGIPCRELEIAPLNLAGLLRAQEYKDGPQSLIILSDAITYLVIVEDGQIRYLYSTTVGAEILGDPAATANWAEELKRALKAYVMETKASVDKAWLLWDREKSPDFDNYLRQELNINAHGFTILQECFHENINPIYALAAVPLLYQLKNIKPSFSLNHFLRSFQVSVFMKRVAVAAAALMLVTGIVLGGIINHFKQIELQAFADSRVVQNQMTVLQKQSANLLNERDGYLAMRQQLLFQATYVKLLKNMSWSQALSVVADEMPHELALMTFKVDEMGAVTFTGEAFRMESIAKLLRTIQTSSLLEQGQFSYLTEAQVEKKKIFRFGILANIKMRTHS